MSYKSIVVHLDTSVRAHARLEFALRVARRFGAHLTGLRRTRVGPLELDRAVSLAELENTEEADRGRYLLPVDALLRSLPEVLLEAESLQRFAHGNPVATELQSGKARVYGEGVLQGVGEVREGKLWPYRLLRQKDNG